MEKLKLETKDLTHENIKKLGALFPNVITEMKDQDGKLKKGINFELLKQELSGNVVDGDEAYDFTWVGKRATIVEANTPIRKTLRPAIDESKDWGTTENLYIEGDNLDALKLLQESYLNSIKMIYIDPPYNTGNDSFVYPDDYSMDQNELDEEMEYRDEEGNINFRRNTETNPRFHSDWCSMMYSRLKLAKSLLSEDGVIFVSIDDNEVHTLKYMCDELFGEVNRVALFSWKRKKEISSDSKNVSIQGEYLLCYGKSSAFQLAYEALDEEYVRSSYYDPNEQFPEGRWRPVPITVSKGLSGGGYQYTIVTPDGTQHQRLWAYPEPSYRRLINEGRVYFGKQGNSIPQRVIYAHESKGQPVSNYWDNVATNKEGKKEILSLFDANVFDTPKPVGLVTKLLSLAADSDSVVLDFFAGSSTTAHAVMQLNAEDGGNRKFIMVQLPEETDEKSEAFKAGYQTIAEIGKERIRRAGEKIKAEVEEANAKLKDGEEAKKVPDIGFRVLKVDSTNMKDVYYAASDVTQDLISQMESNIKEDRGDLDLLYGVMVDWGLKLSLSHKMEVIGGVQVHTVDQGSLMACFADEVSEEVVREIAKRQPLRVVFRDSSFGSSPDKINVEEIFKLLAPQTSVKVI